MNPLVVFVVVHVRIGDAPAVRFLERLPILSVDRLFDRTEAIPNERGDIVAVLRPHDRRSMEELLRLLRHVPGQIPVPRLRGVVEDPVPSAQLVHQSGHPGLHRGDLVDGQRAVFRRRPHPSAGDRCIVHRGPRTEREVKGVSGPPPSLSRPRTPP